MAFPNPQSKPSHQHLADLSALADGTLAPERREAVQANIAASPELSELLARERVAVERLAEARERDRAPQALRERIERERERERAARRGAAVRGGSLRGGLAVRAGLAASLALGAVVLVLVAPGGTPGSPTLSQAAALGTREALRPGPTPDPSNPGAQLDRSVGEVYFPNWTRAPLRWRATGQRIDRLGGHRAVTVFYARARISIAYTILSTPPLREPAAAVRHVGGLAVRELTLNGRMVVTWRRDGHTCVLSGRNIDAQRLAQLASWEPR